nr:tripartite tricarboxylate transporter substrate binding protein [Desulfuromonadales bacterium]
QFVIQTTPGGGSDKYARFWIGLIEKYDLSPQPIIPVNMPGGAGAVAINFLYNQAGSPYFITPTLNSIVTTPLIQ